MVIIPLYIHINILNRCSLFVVRCSLFVVRCSWLVVRESWSVDRGSWGGVRGGGRLMRQVHMEVSAGKGSI